MADFEWDSKKESLNAHKHGIDFTTASLIWEDFVSERLDGRRDYGEARIVAFGVSEKRVLAVVFTWRGLARRIISARVANSRERKLYEEEIAYRGRPPPD
jgi:uncharacterized DUF497 family protein